MGLIWIERPCGMITEIWVQQPQSITRTTCWLHQWKLYWWHLPQGTIENFAQFIRRNNYFEKWCLTVSNEWAWYELFLWEIKFLCKSICSIWCYIVCLIQFGFKPRLPRKYCLQVRKWRYVPSCWRNFPLQMIWLYQSD